ncbi:MAG TPA: GGDEF and EAL domain-containing protein [Mesorhizobium sp.]
MSRTLPDLVVADPRERPVLAQDLWALYRQDVDLVQRTTIRQGIWASLVVYLLFSITDVLLIPDAAALTIASRFAAGFVMIVLFEVQFRSNVRTQWLHITCAFALIVCYLAWLCPALTTTQTTPLSYYLVFGAIFMMGANLFFSFQFMLSIVTSSIVLGIFFVALYFFPSSDAYRVALGTFYVSCFTFTSYVNWKLNKERYHVFLNAQEARNQHHEATERGKALLRLSRTDPLTGLENRRAIDEKLREHWSDWQLLGKSFAAILIDVDFFKKFNDFYGHQEGDRCLVLVANALTAIIDQKLGSLGRYGGEEFIVLVRVDRAEEVVELAEIIRRTVEQLELSHEPRRDGVSVVTVSVGAAITRVQTGAKLEKVIHEADRALYLAKASGRNCIRLFDPNDPQSSDVNENIAALLKIAVANNLVSMVYQPIQDLKSGRVEAVEGLMRLKMLDGTAVPPSLFIPVAERTGAIQELGRWAIRRVCDELLADNSIGIVSVNVSPTQLKALGFASNVATMLAETGVPGSRLAFEITEGLELEMHSDVLRCISDLKRLGIRIWLDDFGTGFAGLSWLRLIDFDTVKIDRSFLHDCTTPRGEAMLRDIIGLVRNRGHKILVEGVETREQLALMREFEIDLVQGFFVGRPVPAKTLRSGPIESKLLASVLRTA